MDHTSRRFKYADLTFANALIDFLHECKLNIIRLVRMVEVFLGTLHDCVRSLGNYIKTGGISGVVFCVQSSRHMVEGYGRNPTRVTCRYKCFSTDLYPRFSSSNGQRMTNRVTRVANGDY